MPAAPGQGDRWRDRLLSVAQQPASYYFVFMDGRLDSGRDMTAAEAQSGYADAIDQVKAAEEEFAEAHPPQPDTAPKSS